MGTRELLTTINEVLGRCALLGIVLILLWFVASVLPGDMICGTQGRLFGMTSHECAVVNYAGIAFVKMLVLIFFVFPWIAIQHVLRKPG